VARPIKAPVPSEKGKSPDARKPRSRSQKWKLSERESSVFLRDEDGQDPDPTIQQLQTSTGRLGHLTSLGYDTSSKHYVGEVKRRVLPAWIIEAWVQINQIGLRRKRHPVLFLHIADTQDKKFECDGKQYDIPELHCLTAERHKQLLEYERICNS